MSEWRTCTLGDVAQLSKNAWKMGDEALPYIGLEHIDENKLRLNGFGFSDDVASNKYHFNQDSFLFGKLRPYFRKLIKPKFQGICSTDIWVVKAKEDNDLNYLFYLFSTEEFIDLSYNGSSGTRMPRADWNFMKETSWNIPPLPEQKAIGEVLSSLDDKIDLLHRQNKTLEALAETLFRHHFIDNAQDDWEEGKLGDICNVSGGYAFKSKDFIENGTPIVKIKNISNNRVDILDGQFVSNTLAKDIDDKYKLSDGDIVMAMTGATIGKIGLICSSDYAYLLLNQRVAVLRSKYQPLLWFLLNAINLEDDILNLSNGAAQANISTFGIEEVSAPKITDEQAMQFNKEVKPMFKKILSNKKQIQILEKIRDTLLPKLISGDVRVQYEEVYK